MVDDSKNFDIKLGTQADTSGLDATERGLRAVEQAGKDASEASNPMTDGSQTAALDRQKAAADAMAEAKQKEADAARQAADEKEREAAAQKELEEARERDLQHQRDLDVVRAKGLRDERELARIRDNARAAQDSAAARAGAIGLLATVAKGSWDALNDAVTEYRRLAPEAAEEFKEPFSTIEIALQTLKDPVGTFIEAITQTQHELNELAKSQKAAAEAEANHLKAAKAHSEGLEAAARRRIQGTLAQELAMIDRQTAAYDRQIRVITALREAEEARARLADQQALANGANPEEIEARAAARQAAVRSATNAETVQGAEQDLAAAIERVKALSTALSETIAKDGPLAESTQRAREAVVGAERDVEDKKAELETVRTEASARQQALISDFRADTLARDEALKNDLNTLNNTTGQQVRDLAQKGIDLIEGIKDEAGGKLSGEAQRILTQLTNIIQDNVPDAEQVDAVRLAMLSFRSSIEGTSKEAYEASTETMRTLSVLAQGYIQLKRDNENLRRMIGDRSVPGN